jgi:hypothetical protein
LRFCGPIWLYCEGDSCFHSDLEKVAVLHLYPGVACTHKKLRLRWWKKGVTIMSNEKGRRSALQIFLKLCFGNGYNKCLCGWTFLLFLVHWCDFIVITKTCTLSIWSNMMWVNSLAQEYIFFAFGVLFFVCIWWLVLMAWFNIIAILLFGNNV